MKQTKIDTSLRRRLLIFSCLLGYLIIGGEVLSQLKIDDAILAVPAGHNIAEIKLENLLEQPLQAEIEIVEVIVKDGRVELQKTAEIESDIKTLQISAQAQETLRLVSNFKPTDTQRTFYIRFFPTASRSAIRFGIQMIMYLEPRVSQRRLCWKTASGNSILVNQGTHHLTLGTMEACNDRFCQTIAGARLFPDEELQFSLDDSYKTLQMSLHEEENIKEMTMRLDSDRAETCVNIKF